MRAASLLAWILSFVPLSASAQTLPFHEIGRLIPGFEPGERAGFGVADFDGDDKDDIVVPALSGGLLFKVVGEMPNGIGVKQVELLQGHDLARVLTVMIGGEPHLFTLTIDGTLKDFSGWPLQERESTQLNTTVVGAAIGDINADGSNELVVTTQTGAVQVHDLASGALQWSLPGIYGTDVLLTQLDADSALEIVVATTPGIIIDGATQAVEWTYVDGFGRYLAAGHFDSLSQLAFVAARDWSSFTVFQGNPYSPLWDMKVSDIDAITVADLDQDGYDEIIQGDGQWGDIKIIDGRTQTIRLSIPHSGYGISALASVDIHGNGLPAIAFSPNGAGGPNSELFRLVDADDGSTIWDIRQEQAPVGPYTPIALGDTDGDGNTELLFGAMSDSFTSPGPIIQLDALDGTQEWQSPSPPGNANAPFYINPRAIRVLPPASGSGPGKIILGGTSIYTGRILGIDGDTHAVLWQIGGYASGPMDGRYLADMATADIDGDGEAEVIACTYPAHTGASGTRLFVFSSHDGSQKWTSVAMGSGFTRCSGVMVGVFVEGGNPLIAAVLPDSIRAFDAQTHLLAWELAINTEGASLLDTGAQGREFAVFHGTWISFYDGATRALLRQFNLNAQITAVRTLSGDIRRLLVAAGNRLLIVDGVSGATLAETDFLGNGLASGNQLAVQNVGNGQLLVGVGSNVGVFRYIVTPDAVDLSRIFAGSFEGP